MKRAFLTVVLLNAFLIVNAQNETMPFGKVDPADLELKECPFEKDANAMVLFDKADVYFDQNFDIVKERHKRIKIFNEKAKDVANIRLEYYSVSHYEELYSLQAQTINIKDGKPVIIKLDKKQIFTQPVDKNQTALVFTFPDVQPGSVVEFKYQWKTPSVYNFPDWDFQTDIPVRYSELKTSIPDIFYYKTQYRIHQPFFKDKSGSESRSIANGGESFGYTLNIRTLALQNIPSLPDEPYMTSRHDNLEAVQFQLTQIKPIGGFVKSYADTWQKIASALTEHEDFGLQLKKKLQGEEAIVSRAKSMKSDEEKIAYIFKEVRNTMKWNNSDSWGTDDGTAKAWQKKTGNSAEINLILCRLLQQADVKNVFPMLVSTRSNGKVNLGYPSVYQFNRTVVRIPADSTKDYILDASNKHHLYNTIPENLLNSYGLSVDRETKAYKLIAVRSVSPSKRTIFVNAQIQPDGKVTGNANIYDFDYYKISSSKLYKDDGEEKFKEWLTERDNTIKIKNVKLEGIDVDTVPLQESFDFEMELKGVDGDYIYFNPNLFSSLRTNPFLSEKRTTVIDFGHSNKYTITGSYQIPEHYKADVLPKSLNLVMPDKSISFRRMVSEAEGKVLIRYIIDFQKSVYIQDEYPLLHQFYKQMFEMLNEQIVLKKS